MINKDTKIILSLSQHPGNFGTIFHNYLYHELNLDYFYKACQCNNIENALHAMKNLNFYGFSISMPFKQGCIRYIDKLDQTALSANAVNTIINQKGTLTGFNTDLYALSSVVADRNITNILIIGTGAIAEMSIRYFINHNLTIIGRNLSRTDYLVNKYNITSQKPAQAHSLVINATPATLKELTSDKYIKNQLNQAPLIIDYPVRSDVNQNKKIITGLDLTLLQAKRQFELYTSVTPSTEQIQKAYHFTKKSLQKI